MERSMELNNIAREIRTCRLCGLHKNRIKAVPGEGPADAMLMFVGEAPGREEDIHGLPFVGQAGKTFDKVIELSGLQREEAFITSVVKCRPPQNRTPLKKEVKICIQAHLKRQIAVIKPNMICLLGGVALQALLGIDRISTARGKFIRKGTRLFYSTYHPAAARRNPSWYRAFLRDMRKLRRSFQK